MSGARRRRRAPRHALPAGPPSRPPTTPAEWWGSFLSAAPTRLLDRQADQVRPRLGIDATTRELLLRSRAEFRERQLAEFYGPIYAYLKRGRPTG